MERSYLPMLVIVVANLVYHYCQKTIPAEVNMAASLVVTYLIALGLSLLWLGIAAPARAIPGTLLAVPWPSYLLGVGVLGIEAGFLLAYRAGWPVSTAALYANAVLTLLLIPMGMIWFLEKVSVINVLGIALALAGLVMMSLR